MPIVTTQNASPPPRRTIPGHEEAQENEDIKEGINNETKQVYVLLTMVELFRTHRHAAHPVSVPTIQVLERYKLCGHKLLGEKKKKTAANKREYVVKCSA